MIGLGSFAYFWQHSDRVPNPLTLIEELEDTREQGVELFQICDYAPLEHFSDAQLRETAAAARDLGITLEVGTRGIRAAHLARFLEIAQALDARFVRSMFTSGDDRPTLDEARRELESAMPAYEAAGVQLGLETYEQLATKDHVGLVDSVGSANLRICLDPANVVARLDNPRDCVELTAQRTLGIHVKDFAFTRHAGWVGFEYLGAPMGSGQHDYPHLLETVNPRERGLNEIVEHWLPWQGDAETTIRIEREWTRTTLEYLRSI